MNNDLISREALKEKLNKKALDLANGGMIFIESINHIIDNAPTVDLKDIYQEGHYDGHLEGYTKAINEEKPQGKWKGKGIERICSVCGFDVPVSKFELCKFCPNCGADMRPKPNQLRDCENCVHHSDNGCEVWECEFKRRSS